MELFLDLLRSVIYGVIEGITEWLPISSTGHMILAEQVLKFSLSAEFMEMFRVVIQLGAILAVVVLYFRSCGPSAWTTAVTPGWPNSSAGRLCGCGSRLLWPACPPPCWARCWTIGWTPTPVQQRGGGHYADCLRYCVHSD